MTREEYQSLSPEEKMNVRVSALAAIALTSDGLVEPTDEKNPAAISNDGRNQISEEIGVGGRATEQNSRPGGSAARLVFVNTTAQAEVDVQENQLSDEFMERLALGLKKSPFSPNDPNVGPLRVRSLEDFEFGFLATQSDSGEFVITIVGVWKQGEHEKATNALKILSNAPIIRSASRAS